MSRDEVGNLLTLFYTEVSQNHEKFLKSKEGFKLKLAEKISRYSSISNYNVLIDYLDTVYKYLEKGFRENKYDICIVDIETKTNLTIDRSAGPIDIIYEVGLAIHPIFGFPYIPGQSLKGAFTHILLRYARFLDDKVEDVLGMQDIDVFTRYVKWFLGHDKTGISSTIFGISSIMFTDAYPVIDSNKDRYFISPDIMTPHYKSDTVDELEVKPTPILYLVVPKGIRFRFIVGVSDRRMDRLSSDIKDLPRYSDVLAKIMSNNNLREKFKGYISVEREYQINFKNIVFDLIDLMLYYGVGGKINTGYSRFEVVDKKGWIKHG